MPGTGRDWHVAPTYRALLATVLDPDLVVAGRTRTPGASHLALACRAADSVVVHEASVDGLHALRRHDTDLVSTVVGLLAPPVTEWSTMDDPAVRLSYPALLRYLDGKPAPPRVASFMAALGRYRYAAKMTQFGHGGGTYHAATAVLVAGSTGP